MTTFLIGVHAVQQGGKNTTAKMFKEWGDAHDLSYRERGFADTMKLSIAKLFFGEDVTMEEAIAWVDSYKLDGTAAVTFQRLVKHERDLGTRPGSSETVDSYYREPCGFMRGHDYIVPSATMRDLAKRMGTEVGRRLWGEDHWVDTLLPLGGQWVSSFEVETVESGVTVATQPADLCLITDVRFENEADRIHDLGGYTIKVRRDEAEQRVLKEAQARGEEIHVSDLLLPDYMFDSTFDNNAGLPELRDRVVKFCMKHLAHQLVPQD